MARLLRTMSLIVMVCLVVAAFSGGIALAEQAAPTTKIPQIDSSTARIPITDALYQLLTDKYKLDGPKPVCSKTHGAWLNLADRKADILFTVAPTAEEMQYFQQKGVRIEVKVYGYDGLVFLGNQDNYVSDLTSDQICGIYTGAITNWSSFEDGDDAPIDAYVRDAQSGSQRLFEQLVWAGREMPDFSSPSYRVGEIETIASAFKVTEYEEMEAIVAGVSENQYSIGFNIMSYVDDKFLHPWNDENIEQVVRASGSVNLRSGPGLNYKDVGTIKKGETLPYLKQEATDERGVIWFKAQSPADGEVWVSSRYCDTHELIPPAVKLFSIDGADPTTENFASGAYPFVTTSIVAIRMDEPEDSPARQLFNWIGSEESRALIAQNSTLAVGFSDPYEYTGVVE